MRPVSVPDVQESRGEWVRKKVAEVPAWVDIAGAILLVLILGWTYLSSVLAGGRATTVVALLLVAGVAYAAGRAAGWLSQAVVPGAVIVVAAFMWWQDPQGVLSTSPLAGPFGYANARGAFFALAAIAGLMLLTARAPIILRLAGLVAALVLGTVPFSIRSLAPAGLLVAAAPVVLVGMIGARWSRVAVGVLAGAFLVASMGTVLVAAGRRPGAPTAVEDLVVRRLTERRLVLWSEAFDIMAARPLAGAGPTRFSEVSPTAKADADARWAHHAFLQQGAEGGVPAFVLLMAVFLWAFAVLLFHPSPTGVAAAGAAALAVAGIHASVDYAFHFPAIPVTLAALVGSAHAVPLPRHGYRRARS